jgi:hypothetical protein
MAHHLRPFSSWHWLERFTHQGSHSDALAWPDALAYFLEGCSSLTLHHAGQILLERLKAGRKG